MKLFHFSTLPLFTILTNIYLVAKVRSMTAFTSETIPLAETTNRGEDSTTPRIACCCELPDLRFASKEAERLAAIFKAIGHPVRLQIMDILSRFGGQVCVCDIEGQFDLTQPTISHHLKTLRQAGAIDCEVRGLWAYYFIKPGLIDQLRTLLGEWMSQKDR